MLGSAVQNGVALTDSIFLFYHDETDFAAIGIVSVFYLIISAIGYGFSKGGQILVARRYGSQAYEAIGASMQQMLLFLGLTALVLFGFLYLMSEPFLSLIIDNPVIVERCVTFLNYRSWSIFFSFFGLAYIALYTGVARTTFIIVDVVVMLLLNIFLNYVLISGKWGFPEMGIAGAGLASAISETVAFVLFVIYANLDPMRKAWKLNFSFRFNAAIFRQIFSIGLPVVAQSIVGLGSWFVFFAFVEKMGERALAVTNLGRIVYLFFSIPCWGFSSGINTIVSFLIGQGRKNMVLVIIRRTAILSVLTTLLLAGPILGFPEFFLGFFEGSGHTALLQEAAPVFRMILLILVFFCIGGIYYNGLVGTGDTWFGLWIQVFGVLMYVLYIHLVINVFQLNLTWAWSGEVFYWILILALTGFYIRSGHWRRLNI